MEPSRSMALRHLTALPQSAWHDEYLFLRTIQCSECCFWGVMTGVIGAMEEAKLGRLQHATELLNQASGFARFLIPLFDAFKTMPTEAFREFRDDTGDASAIQSRTYQQMQIFTQGLDERKIHFIAAVPENVDLLLMGHPNFIHLGKLIQLLDQSPQLPGLAQFKVATQELDDALFRWRQIHLGIAKRYLGDLMGSGATPGFTYLKSHYDHKILPAHCGQPALIPFCPPRHDGARPVFSSAN